MTSTQAPLRFLGIAGSLRRGSCNRGLIRAAVELAPAGITVIPCDLVDLPMFNADVEVEGGLARCLDPAASLGGRACRELTSRYPAKPPGA